MKAAFMNDLAQLLEIDPNELKPDFRLDKCLSWDSLAVVSTIALIDQHFNKHIEGQTLEQCKTVSDLLNMAN
jgi:acyl carrier protein